MRMRRKSDKSRDDRPDHDAVGTVANPVAPGVIMMGMGARLVAAAVGSVVVLLVVAWLLGGCASTQSASTETSTGSDSTETETDADETVTTPDADSTPADQDGVDAPTSEPTLAPTKVAADAESPNAAGPGSPNAAGPDTPNAAGPGTPNAAGPDTPSAAGPGSDADWESFEVVGTDFAGAVQPILEHKCASCHLEGGAGSEQLVLATAGDAAAAAEDIADAVAVRYMPPWPASHDSLPFRYDRSLTDEQLDILVNWGETGGALDVPAETPITEAVEPIEITEPDSEFRIEPYQSQSTVTDDYRCFIVAPGEAESRWITGFDLVPDQTENVHHAIVYRVDGSQREEAESRNGSDGQPGWTCYGETGLGGSALLLGWAPGQDAFIADPGTAFPVQAESFLVMQIHYHFEGPAPVDETALKVNWGDPGGDYRPFIAAAYVGPVEIPCAEGEDGPLCDRDTAMAAAVDRYGSEGVRNDFINFACGVQPEDFAAMTTGEVTSSCTLPAYAFGDIVSILGHEHELGSSFRLTLNRGAEDIVLLDIPDWDFNWQYQYRPAEQVSVAPGDTITIECGWDRKRRDPDADPSYVLWADGTSDEMCFATILTVEPT